MNLKCICMNTRVFNAAVCHVCKHCTIFYRTSVLHSNKATSNRILETFKWVESYSYVGKVRALDYKLLQPEQSDVCRSEDTARHSSVSTARASSRIIVQFFHLFHVSLSFCSGRGRRSLSQIRMKNCCLSDYTVLNTLILSANNNCVH